MCDLLAPLLVILDDGESVFVKTAVLYLFLSSCHCLKNDISMFCFSHLFLLNLSEAMAFSCFTELMKRMNQNFPHGGAMDTHFANMRSLIQVKRLL